ncbi:DNA-3-methyladenine glycosylase [Carboxylicivirga linearis]|uniref:Putative 3-methyladenine DNA glycosylase n=1 Tax=Carboxylicivirga linearis TaxID=1628157 RepID=A0ABS5JTM3_9BACT|nr:DNA-3-methyladenine glycosylase [Carboxylicivirga linearis]MBS2098256.1 DNA-3-methyladenine glycosylase [Carboxylicivirga linearis]
MKLGQSYFMKDVLDVAPDLIGKILFRQFNDGSVERWRITETEAYRGEEDEACHARKGKTPRTEVMYEEGGLIYVYLIYGMYWLLNVVTGPKDDPQAVLIRGLENIDGPGRVGKALQLNKTFYGEDLTTSLRMWIENGQDEVLYETSPRIGIDYAPDEWRLKNWRYFAKK